VTNYEAHSPIATTVKAVYVQPGDHVAAGKLLMELDGTEARARVAAAESGVKAAQAALDAVTHNGTVQERQVSAAEVERARLEREAALQSLDALTKLNTSGAASASEVTAARQRLAIAEAALHSAQEGQRTRYSEADAARSRAALVEAQAALDAARKVEAGTQVHSPIAGTMYSLNAGRTEFAEEGKLLLQIADLRNLRVRAYFDEPDIGRLAIGQPVEIKWDARPGNLWHGQIERVPVTVTTYGTRNVGEVLVKVNDADGQLLPDTNVTVTVTTSSEANVMSIPREALHMENGKSFVFRVVNDELKRTPVVAGTITLTQVAILSGLNEGDWLASGTLNGQPLQEGLPIKALK
jgi:HlyD family secretion protein